MAYVHGCSLRATIRCVSEAPGRPKSKKCRHCGGAWTVREGRYAVLWWRGDGNYRVEDALSLHQTYVMAERRVTHPDRQAIRFLTVP